MSRPSFARARPLVLGGAVLLALLGYLRLAPLDAPDERGTRPGTVLLDATGLVLARDETAGLRIPVRLDAVAPRMIQATIAAEDRRFRGHPGIDPVAVLRALLHGGSQPSGASTITQQLARRLYLSDDGTPALVRKAREGIIALQLEARRSKDEILALYLNDVYYGRGAYGVEAAARVYFGTSAGDLDLAHAAYLAGLPQRPARYASTSDQAPALARQAYVLGRLADDGWITRAEADLAQRQPVGLLPEAPAPLAAHFVAQARAELARLRPDLTQRNGLVIETTLDAGLQAETERLVRLHLAQLAERHATNGALVAIEPASGRILALVGSATDGDPTLGGAIDMTRSPRPAGSTLKPLLYAAGFERGLTPATTLLDVPTAFATDRGQYTPLNFDRSFRGPVPLRTALGSSLNVPAVRTLATLGLESLLEISHRFGLTTLSTTERYGLSLSLGGGEVRLLDLTAAYSAIGTGGRLAEPHTVTRVRDGRGQVLYERAPAAARRVLSPQHAYLLADILSDPDARIPGFGWATPFDLPFPAAVKSGTSTGFRDVWTVGTTPELAVGVWVGNTDGSPMQDVQSVEGAGPIWHDAMLAAALARRMSPFVRPDGILDVVVCAPTGLLPGPDCPSPVRELFVAGTEPREHERYFARAADGSAVITPPLEAIAWARDAGIALSVEFRPGATERLRIVAPQPGSVFYLAPELDRQMLVLRWAAAPGSGEVSFEIDGQLVATRPAQDRGFTWPLEPGSHTVRASVRLPDGSIAAATSFYEVRR